MTKEKFSQHSRVRARIKRMPMPAVQLNTRVIIWTSSDQASNNGLRSTPRSGEGEVLRPSSTECSFSPFCFSSTFFFIQIQMKLNKHAWMLFLVSCVYCSDLFPGIWHQHDILLWNAFFNLSCILEHVFSISWYRVLRASFSNWSVTFFKSCLKVYK